VGLFAISGVLEGFYGKPWSWEERRAVMERCVPAGLPWYAWAPKADPLHRDAWREPFTDEHLAGFADLLSIDGLKLCVAIAPGVDPGEFDDDLASLIEKLEPVLQLVEANGSHIPMVMVAFDDLGPDSADGNSHALLVSALSEALEDRVLICTVPAHYAGVSPTEYLTAFSDALPPDVLVGWTGPLVVNETINAYDAQAFADAVDGRPLLLWDNYPVNDVFMRDRLFLHPLRGRDSLLSEFCHAYFANAGTHAMLSLPPLLSAGSWCEDGVSTEAWEEFDEPVQLAMLAEACEGGELFRLAETAVADLESQAFDDLWWWLERIDVLELTGAMGTEAAPWIAQANAEAELSLIAMDLLEREPGDEEVPELLIDLMSKWPKVRRAQTSVFGPRFALRPALGVIASGVWTMASVDPGPVVEDRNATDVLCRGAIARHAVA
jgi:hyaluronoglucosaminidase